MQNRLFLLLCLVLLSFSNGWAKKETRASVTTPADETGILYLSGKDAASAVEWDFLCTDGNNSGYWTKIKVPSCWELQGFGTYQYGMSIGKAVLGVAKEQGHYKTTFKLPAEWSNRNIRIVFDGVMTDCSATINNRPCVKLHQGAFYRFSSNITDRVFFGEKENKLEITVSKESANSSVNAAERRGDYWNFGGIFRPVFIEARPAAFIDRTAIDAKADGSLKADVYLGYATDADYQLEVTLSDAQGKPVGKPFVQALRKGSDKIHVETTFDQILAWTPETPNLYTLHFTLKEGKQSLHKVKERIGFRTIEVREHDGLYINGQKVMAKGVNRHSFRPETGRALSREDNLADVKLMKEMNMNAVRLSHYPPDPVFLDYCDSLGLYVMNELGGWHGKYDTEVGRKLVHEMIPRDLNHPCIIWWSNGNEGGFNYELEADFIDLDIQKRPVIYPWENRNQFETMHYRSYGESQEYMRKPEIFMPTEFLHGLYDGGHGAGLWEYWEMMRQHPRCAGGFLWVFADEGVVRTDQNGRIDNVGNYGADGIVGPHHEKEGSFFTIKEIWSPVHVKPAGQAAKTVSHTEMLREDQRAFIADADAFGGKFKIENRYDFIDLKDCRFHWELAQFDAGKKGHSILSQGELQSASIPAHEQGEIQLKLPGNWKNADALYLTAIAPTGQEIYTWGYYWKSDEDYVNAAFKEENKQAGLNIEEPNAETLRVSCNTTTLSFDKKTGTLTGIDYGTQHVSIEGPHFIAARRSDRSMDVFYNHDDKFAKSKDRVYKDISGEARLTDFRVEQKEDHITITADYFGNLRQVCWNISKNGDIRMDYAYQYDGTVELAGVYFDYPEEKMQAVRFLAKGPYRVWQNRQHGTVFGVWENEYNDPIPGESFTYPEFKGYFNDWKWAEFQTAEAKILLGNGTPDSYLGVYTPRDGRDALLYTIPQSGIAVLDVIPGVRNKVNSTDLVGPSSQAKWLNGLQKGMVRLKINP